MGMGRVDAAERVEELSAFYLQAEGQVCCLEEGFFQLDLGFVVVIELQDDVREAFEIRVDRAIEGDLGIASIEATLLRIVVADFELIEMAIARCCESKHAVER